MCVVVIARQSIFGLGRFSCPDAFLLCPMLIQAGTSSLQVPFPFRTQSGFVPTEKCPKLLWNDLGVQCGEQLMDEHTLDQVLRNQKAVSRSS